MTSVKEGKELQIGTEEDSIGLTLYIRLWQLYIQT